MVYTKQKINRNCSAGRNKDRYHNGFRACQVYLVGNLPLIHLTYAHIYSIGSQKDTDRHDLQKRLRSNIKNLATKPILLVVKGNRCRKCFRHVDSYALLRMIAEIRENCSKTRNDGRCGTCITYFKNKQTLNLSRKTSPQCCYCLEEHLQIFPASHFQSFYVQYLLFVLFFRDGIFLNK